jgi:hypothetical protein
LLFPRLGDWAVVKLPDKRVEDPARKPPEDVIGSGFFDEQWAASGRTRP